MTSHAHGLNGNVTAEQRQAHIDTLRAKLATLTAEHIARTSRGIPTPGWFLRHIELIEDQIADAQAGPAFEYDMFPDPWGAQGWAIVVGILLAVGGVIWAVV